MDKAQNIRSENSHKEVPNKGKEDKTTQVPAAKIQNLQTEKVSLSFNLGADITKLNIVAEVWNTEGVEWQEQCSAN